MSKLTTGALSWYPPAADDIALTPSGSAWGNSSWVEIEASTGTDVIVTHVVVAPGNVDAWFEIDVGIGPAASEVVIGTLKGWRKSGELSSLETSLAFGLGLDAVPAGSRIAIRMRKAGTDTSDWHFAVGYIEQASVGTWTEFTNEIQEVLPSAADGISVSSGTGAWADGAFAQLSSSLANNIYVVGVTVGHGSFNGSGEVDLATGGSGSESVIATIPFTGPGSRAISHVVLPTPLFIAGATRLTARVRCDSGTSVTMTVAIEYFGGLVAVPPTGGGGVPPSTNPAPAVIGVGVNRLFARFILPGGSPQTEKSIAETTLNNPSSWFGGTASPWLLECAPIERRLSDTLDGVEVRIVAADPDRWFRQNMVSGTTVEIYTVDDATRYALQEPYRRFAGKVIDHSALEGYRYSITLRDVLSEAIAEPLDSPRVPPGRLTQAQFPGMEASYEGKAIPLVMGVCSDTIETGNISVSPQGVIPPVWVGTINLQAAFGGVDVDVLAGFWTMGAIAPNGIWEVYFNTIDDPYQRIPVPGSAWGTIAATPGFPGWALTGLATDYADYPLPAGPGTHRFVPFFILLDTPYGQYVKDGRVLVAANMYGITENADGTGNYISDAPRIYQWLITNMLFTPYEYGAYASVPVLDGGYSVIDNDSVELATTRLRSFNSGNYDIGFMLGRDGQQQTLRHILEEICSGVLMEQGIDRHGRIIVDVEDSSAAAIAQFSALHDIEEGTFETWIDRQGYCNTVEYLHGRRYVPPVAPVPTPPEGETLPAKPQEFAEWTSGLQTSTHTAALSAAGGKQRLRRLENYVVRDPVIAADVVTRLLDRSVGPSPAYDGARMFRFAVPIAVGSQQGGTDIELGSVIEITHLDGFGNGLTDAPGRVLRIVDDIQRGRRTLEGRLFN